MTEQNPLRRQAHIAGLDFLRILSMVMIIGLHMLGQGGIVEAAEPDSPQWFAVKALECLFYCSADCFGLLSGYVGSSRKGNGPRLLILWLTVVLYSLLFALFFRLRSPQYVTAQSFVNALLPVLTRQYWYFTGYFGMALIVPLLNGGPERAGEKSAVRWFFALVLFFSLLPTVTQIDAFHMRGGYTALWILLLYLMGVMLRRGALFRRVGVLPLCLCAAVCYALTYYTALHPVNVPFFSSFTLLYYTAPTVTLFAACLVLLFSRLPGRGGAGTKLVTGLSRASFGVYILHTNPLLWFLLCRPGFLKEWAQKPAGVLAALVPLCAVGTYLVCAAADGLRGLLFRALRLRRAADRLFARLAPAEEESG